MERTSAYEGEASAKIEVLRVLNDSRDPFVIFDLLGELAILAESNRDVMVLVDYLRNHDDPIVRHEAAAQLAEIWRTRPSIMKGVSKEVTQSLLWTAIKDKSPTARHEAIEALGFIGNSSIIQSLTRMLRDRNDDIRRTTKIAIDIIRFRENNHVGFNDLSRAILKTKRKRQYQRPSSRSRITNKNLANRNERKGGTY